MPDRYGNATPQEIRAGHVKRPNYAAIAQRNLMARKAAEENARIKAATDAAVRRAQGREGEVSRLLREGAAARRYAEAIAGKPMHPKDAAWKNKGIWPPPK